MKKQFILAAIAAIALTSCQEEKDFVGGKPMNDKEVAFVLGGAETRAAEDAQPVSQGVFLELGQIGGNELYLEETIEDLNAVGAATRGTPVYTENLGHLYKAKLAVRTKYGQNGVSDDAFQQQDDEMFGDAWRYGFTYQVDIWGDGTSDVEFYPRMPSDMESHGVSSLNYSTTATTKFSYTSPAEADQQQDIIFGWKKMNFEQYKAEYTQNGGARITLYHALTGVKFAIANPSSEISGIKFKIVAFTGLANKGTCEFRGNAAGTATDPKIVWTSTEVTSATNRIMTLEPDVVSYDKDQNTNKFGDSFYDGGTNQNLNDATASKTFWLIPQSVSSASTAKLVIEYTLNGQTGGMEIGLNELHAAEWKPGQLRTYTFKLNEVNLKVEDDVTLAGGANDGFSGSTKQDITITNTGNTRTFIRASLVGQWLRDVYALDPETGEETNVLIESYPVFGFTDNVNNLYEVASWYQDQFVKLEGASAPARAQGQFKDLSGYDKDNGYNDWVLCEDGYYYYTVALEPESKDVNGNSKTQALFTEYKVGTAPMSKIAGLAIKNKNMHFTLEIATQAVAANKRDGTVDTWLNAWQKAGVTPVPVQ